LKDEPCLPLGATLAVPCCVSINTLSLDSYQDGEVPSKISSAGSRNERRRQP